MSARPIALVTGLILWLGPLSQLTAAGLDDETSRIDAGDYNKSDPSSRFTTPDGSVKMDNGLIVKWGEATVAGFTNTTTVTFASPFPTNVLSVHATVNDTSANTYVTVSGESVTGFTINVQCFSLTGLIACSGDTDLKWSARGY